MTAFVSWITASIRTAGWAPLAFFALHVAVSKIWNGYHKVPNLDVPAHFLGGVAIAYFFWRAVNHPSAEAVIGKFSIGGKVILTFGFIGTSTVFWEFAEWTTDHFGYTQSQGGLDDTMLDMFLGLAGGLFWLAIAANKRTST